MIFQHTWQQVLDGSKTHLRRLVKPGDRLFDDTISLGISPDHPLYIPTRVGAWMKHPKEFPFRLKYECGRTYAVQPGRTEKGIARIRITGIRRERVQDITEEQAIAEGIPVDADGVAMAVGRFHDSPRDAFAALWATIHPKPPHDWASNPWCFVYTFHRSLRSPADERLAASREISLAIVNGTR